SSGAPAAGRPPYPPVPRPVSGARGAASVPSGPPAAQPVHKPVQPQPYRQPYQPQATPAAKPQSSGGRQVLIVLAVVLALLVLLCAGVISFLYKQGQNQSGAPTGVTVVHTGVADGDPSGASNRLTPQAGANPGWTKANEGRQTL
ncbi:serine/threonine protein kinase, partial [Actinoplanes sp. TRM 88003]|nr:serine/threonine protein kinase [Actinoplanes aksuensis]